jgi:hypothetical protein
MANDSLNRRAEMPAEQVAEDDYRSFCEALSSSARGRAFLDEFARRNRHADTEVVLTALGRLEASALSHAATSSEAERIRQDLRALLDTLRTARPQTENSPTAIKAATLAALIDFAQARIEAVVMMPTAANEGEALAAVPALEQPELPIPHPAAATAPLMAVVQAPARAEPAMAATAPQSFVLQAKRKSATVIPIVEFDYRAHQSGRPASVWSAPEEAWTALAPPHVSSPLYAAPATPQPVPFIAEPDSVPAPVATPATEVETYELWLDPPTVASAEPETLANAEAQTAPLPAELAPAVEAFALDLATAIEPMLERAVSDMLASEMTIAELTTSEAVASETGVSEVAATEMAAATQIHEDATATAGATMSTIETLMEQMEQAAAPATMVKGHAEADPLAPLMALSEEERIALFT